jgi:hypothetical protein
VGGGLGEGEGMGCRVYGVGCRVAKETLTIQMDDTRIRYRTKSRLTLPPCTTTYYYKRISYLLANAERSAYWSGLFHPPPARILSKFVVP